MTDRRHTVRYGSSERDRRPQGGLWSRNPAATLAIAGLLGAAWVGGTYQAQQKFAVGPKHDARTGVAPQATVHSEDATASAWDLPNLNHPRVDYWVERFTTDKRGDMAKFLERSGRYAPMISQKLTERGMPQDLIYLAMIESGMNPKAYSPAHASGLWQFIRETGQRYGLDVNRAVDERNDPVKSTDAALTYLQEMYERFGSWYLAAAGYNTGENRVGRIMREETGSERGTEESYYRIWDRLPRETRDYVPLMIAAARIAKEPAKYGFDGVEYEAPLEYEEVPVDPATPLTAVAEAAGVPLKVLKQLNPHLKLNRTRNDMQSLVRVPDGTRTAFLVNWPQTREERTYAVSDYKVRRGDALISIAKRHGVSVRDLRQENNIRGDRIRAGEVLRIPTARAR